MTYQEYRTEVMRQLRAGEVQVITETRTSEAIFISVDDGETTRFDWEDKSL